MSTVLFLTTNTGMCLTFDEPTSIGGEVLALFGKEFFIMYINKGLKEAFLTFSK